MSRSYKSRNRYDGENWKKYLKHESKTLRTKEREFCDKCVKDPDIFDDVCVEKINEVSNPWNWD